MSTWKVKTDSLNLRRSPAIEAGNIIRTLPLAQDVTVVSGLPSDRFWEVETTLDGETLKGFVSATFLRKPVSDAREALITAAVTEWLRFDQGDGLEFESPYYTYVGEYWKGLGLNLDGQDTDQPWSAAFISHVVRKAGYKGFKFAAAHAHYIRDAAAKRRTGDKTAPFWGFDLNEHKPQLGDLVCLWREKSVSFDRLPSGGFKSHCDIVVEVRDREVRVLGGNVNDSVSMRSFPLDARGFLKPADKVFAVLRNNN